MTKDGRRGAQDEFWGRVTLDPKDHVNPQYQTGREFMRDGWSTPRTDKDKITSASSMTSYNSDRSDSGGSSSIPSGCGAFLILSIVFVGIGVAALGSEGIVAGLVLAVIATFLGTASD